MLFPTMFNMCLIYRYFTCLQDDTELAKDQITEKKQKRLTFCPQHLLQSSSSNKIGICGEALTFIAIHEFSCVCATFCGCLPMTKQTEMSFLLQDSYFEKKNVM